MAVMICNKGCGRELPQPKMLKRYMGNGIIKYILKCPHCGHEYRIFYEDNEMRRLRRSIRSGKLSYQAKTNARKRLVELETALEARFEGSGSNP